ncbi:hypothetical protein BJX70DRAFT_399880 [Aspergillus crustosus]
MVIFPLENHNQKTIVGVSIAFIILPSIAVPLRLYGRRLKGLSWDCSDYLIIWAWVNSLAYSSVTILLVFDGGVGVHTPDIIHEHGLGPMTTFLKGLIAAQILAAVSSSSVKLSLLSFYCRLFAFPYFIFAARAIAVFILLWTCAVIMAPLLMCQPFAYNVQWGRIDTNAHCGDNILYQQIIVGFNLLTDLVVLVMPMRCLLGLGMKKSQKIPLIAVFGLGIFVCVATTMRLLAMSILTYEDMTFNIAMALMWTAIEPALGTTLACVLFMKPVFSFSRSIVERSDPSRGHSSLRRVFGRKTSQYAPDPYPLQTFITAGGMEEARGLTSPQSRGHASSREALMTAEGLEGRNDGMEIMVHTEFEIR